MGELLCSSAGVVLDSMGRTLGIFSAMSGSRCPPIDPSSATLSATSSIVAAINNLKTTPSFAPVALAA